MSRKPFADYSTDDLIRAIKANWAEYFRFSGRFSGAKVDECPEFMRFSCAVPTAFFNGVFHTKLVPGRVDAAIEETIAHFQSRNVPAFSWWLEPDMQPTNLGEYLESHGLALQEGPTGMAIDLENVQTELPSPAGLNIEVIHDEETLRPWSSVCATCFGLTDFEEYSHNWWAALGFDLPIRYYLGLLNGEPVATSALLLAEDVAGVYCVGVLPDARKQGIGAAVTIPPLLDARAEGCRVGILQASSMGYSVYRRVGFVEYCKMEHYVWEQEAEVET